jgi:hypothetical protein
MQGVQIQVCTNLILLFSVDIKADEKLTIARYVELTDEPPDELDFLRCFRDRCRIAANSREIVNRITRKLRSPARLKSRVCDGKVSRNATQKRSESRRFIQRLEPYSL